MDNPKVNVKKLTAVRRIIYLLVAAAVIVPYILQPSLPGKPNHWTEIVYDRIEALKPGSHVLLAFDYDPSSQAELQPMSRAILLHCFKKDIIPVVMAPNMPQAVSLMVQTCKDAAQECQKKWDKQKQPGRDYVVLGFRPGGSMLLLKMGENLKDAFEKDYYGNPTRDMKALAGLDSLKDLDFAVDLTAVGSVTDWIAYGSDRFDFPLAVGTTAVQAPDMYPWLQSKQIVGFLGGLRGAADYEILLNAPGKPGLGILGMPSQSAAHVLLIVLILGANVRFIAGRLRQRAKG
jgi:hypothetical protein